MAIVVLPETLNSKTEGREPLEIEGSTALEILRSLEHELPALRGWILDDNGGLRPHVALFVDRRQIAPDEPVGDQAELFVVQSISGGAPAGPEPDTAAIELLLGTRKGLFVLRGERHGAAEVVAREFAGLTVDYACYDHRTGTYFAALTHGQFGPHLCYATDPEGPWEEASGLALPADSGSSIERIWMVEPGQKEGVLWAGVAPAALFQSRDGGRSWELNQALWDEPSRAEWGAGLGGQALHSICPWPGEPGRLAVGVSAAGVWLTDDEGRTWYRGVEGLVPPLSSRGGPSRDLRPLCPQDAPCPSGTRDALSAVPRRRLCLRQRRSVLA